MAKATKDGKSLYLEFAGVVIDTDFRDFDPGISEQETDSTAGADGLVSSHKIRDMVDPTLSILLQDDASGDAIRAALEHGNTGNLIWGPDGNGTGERRWGIEARVVANLPLGHASEQVLDVTFKNIGRDWLYDGNSSTF